MMTRGNLSERDNKMGLMKLGVESRGGRGGIKEGIVGGLFGWKP